MAGTGRLESELRPWPPIVLGTGGLRGDEALSVITHGIDLGYRTIDTAFSYGNETDVGKAVRRHPIARSEIQIVTKLPGRAHGYAKARACLHQQLDSLNTDYIDTYLIHWPLPRAGRYLETWQALIDAAQEGLVRSIGVSNFTTTMIRELRDKTGVTPSVVQFESHPWWPQEALVDEVRSLSALPMAWSPLRKCQGGMLQARDLAVIADLVDMRPAEAVLAWHIARGVVPVVKSRDREHLRSNLEVACRPINAMLTSLFESIKHREPRGGDPDTHEEF